MMLPPFIQYTAPLLRMWGSLKIEFRLSSRVGVPSVLQRMMCAGPVGGLIAKPTTNPASLMSVALVSCSPGGNVVGGWSSV